MSRTLVHYSTEELTPGKLMRTTRSQMSLHYNGKPSGLWYGYGDDWKNAIRKISKSNAIHKHIFTVPESAFITDVNVVDASSSILVLNAASFDAFMTRFHVPEYLRSSRFIIELAFEKLQQEGEVGAILNEIAESDEEFKKYIKGFINYITGFAGYNEDFNTNNEEFLSDYDFSQDPHTIINDAIEYFDLSDIPISDAALSDDGLSRYDWITFWQSVRSVFGGIEFMPDIFKINQWRDVPIQWTSLLEIHSGVIFNPTTFRGGVNITIQKGGRRHTRKGVHKRKNKSRRRLNKRN